MASKRRARPPTPTLGELQKMLEANDRRITEIRETLTLLVQSLCSTMKINMALAQIRATPRQRPDSEAK